MTNFAASDQSLVDIAAALEQLAGQAIDNHEFAQAAACAQAAATYRCADALSDILAAIELLAAKDSAP